MVRARFHNPTIFYSFQKHPCLIEANLPQRNFKSKLIKYLKKESKEKLVYKPVYGADFHMQHTFFPRCFLNINKNASDGKKESPWPYYTFSGFSEFITFSLPGMTTTWFLSLDSFMPSFTICLEYSLSLVALFFIGVLYS